MRALPCREFLGRVLVEGGPVSNPACQDQGDGPYDEEKNPNHEMNLPTSQASDRASPVTIPTGRM